VISGSICRGSSHTSLRHAYLEIAPDLEPYFTTGHHDDAPGLAASSLLPPNPGRPWGYFLVNAPAVLATVEAALAAAVAVLAVRQAGAPATIAVATAAAAFLLVWAALVSWERHTPGPGGPDDGEVPHAARPPLNGPRTGPPHRREQLAGQSPATHTVPLRPDGWPDWLGRRPTSSSDRARLR